MPAPEALLTAFAALVTGRRINDQAYALVRQGRLAVYPSSHGQEACQVAAAQVLADGDWLFPTYRDTVAAVARGVDPVEVLVLLKGDWHSGYDPSEHHVAPQATPLATQLLHAVGVAHAARLRGEPTVVMAMCGDGATSEGDFHEALNFAAVFRAPVVFFVQNNEYAISVPLARQSVAPSLAHKGIGYGVPGERVDAARDGRHRVAVGREEPVAGGQLLGRCHLAGLLPVRGGIDREPALTHQRVGLVVDPATGDERGERGEQGLRRRHGVRGPLHGDAPVVHERHRPVRGEQVIRVTCHAQILAKWPYAFHSLSEAEKRSTQTCPIRAIRPAEAGPKGRARDTWPSRSTPSTAASSTS